MNAAPAIDMAPPPVALTPGVRPWRRHLTILGLAVAALLALFGHDAFAMARIWWTASTYEHCLFILPITGWLVWQRLPELRRLAPRAFAPALGIVALGAFGWLLGQAAGVALARHAGLVLMLQGTIIACLGWAVARGLAFPIFYLVFLVPAGEELVPPLQTLTAQMCMGLLWLAHVPARLDGVFITLPTGRFEVAAACSGVKFLVAMLAFGALAANVGFRSRRRRATFLVACIVVPVLANGLRAFGTIYVAHLTDARFADGFDHIVYGWIFFGLVIAAVIAGGWRFFDRGAHEPWFDPARLQPRLPPHQPRAKLAAVALCALLIAAAPLGWARAIAASGAARLAPVALPDVPGWTHVPSAGVPWRPRFDGADGFAMARYRDPAGRTADLAIAAYAGQSEGREVVGYGQGAVDPDGDWAWTSNTAAPPAGAAMRIIAPGPVVREVAVFYRVGDVTTGSPEIVKLETLKLRLFGGPQRAVALLVSAEEQGGRSARPAIDAFLRALGPVDHAVDRAAAQAR